MTLATNLTSIPLGLGPPKPLNSCLQGAMHRLTAQIRLRTEFAASRNCVHAHSAGADGGICLTSQLRVSVRISAVV